MADARIWDGTNWISLMGPQGPEGPAGKDGSGVTIKGTATTYPPTASPATGDMWIVGDPVPAGSPPGTEAGDGLVWTGTSWENVGGIRGPKGDKGADGADGAPGQDGMQGADGIGFVYRGEFAAGPDYERYDVVTFNGSSYVLLTTPNDTNNTPDLEPDAWKLLAAKGADGVAGADGAKGDKGDTGSDGADGRSVEVYVQASQPAGAVKGDFWIEP